MEWVTPVLVALISGTFAYLGANATVKVAIAKLQTQIEAINSNIKRLEDKQDKHNNLIERTYKLEQKVEDLTK